MFCYVVFITFSWRFATFAFALTFISSRFISCLPIYSHFIIICKPHLIPHPPHFELLGNHLFILCNFKFSSVLNADQYVREIGREGEREWEKIWGKSIIKEKMMHLQILTSSISENHVKDSLPWWLLMQYSLYAGAILFSSPCDLANADSDNQILKRHFFYVLQLISFFLAFCVAEKNHSHDLRIWESFYHH